MADVKTETELLAILKRIADEAEFANNVIAHNRDGAGSGRIKVATAMHRIERLARDALPRS